MIVRILLLGDDDWAYRSTEAFDHHFRTQEAALAAAKKKLQPIFAIKRGDFKHKPGSRWYFKTQAEVRRRWSIATQRNYHDEEPKPTPKIAIHSAPSRQYQDGLVWGSIGQGAHWKRPRRYWESDTD